MEGNAVTETPFPPSIIVPGDNIEEIQRKIKKMGRCIGVGTGLMYIHAFIFRRRKERRERIAAESQQTKMDVDTEKNMKLNDGELQSKESLQTMTDVDTEKNLKLNDGELQNKESLQTTADVDTEKNLKLNDGELQNKESLQTVTDVDTEKNLKLNDGELQSKESLQTTTDVDTEKNLKLNDGELQNKESLQTMTDMKTEKKTDAKNKVLKRKHGDQQGVETFKEDVEPMTAKNSVNDSAETSALTRSETFKEDVEPMTAKNSVNDSAETSALTKSDQKLKSVSSLQEETETPPKHHVEHAIKMMKALHRSSSDDDYAVYKTIKGGFHDYFRELLFQSGALSSTEATVEGGKKETNTDCVIQKLAESVIKGLELTYFGTDSEYDPSDVLDVRTDRILKGMVYSMSELFRLYIAEESEKDKMASNGADLKRRKTENISICDGKSSLEKDEGGNSEA